MTHLQQQRHIWMTLCAVGCCRQRALSIQRLTHGYQDRMLFDNTSLEIEKGERVAVIGAPPRPRRRCTPPYCAAIAFPDCVRTRVHNPFVAL